MKQLLILFMVFLSLNAYSQKETDRWVTYMTPGSFHQKLEKYTGDFKVEITMWMSADKVPMIDDGHRLSIYQYTWLQHH
ncbi:hypothetical protein [Pedobacter immunditicola]|uniref:hypothetical protein n=1 Tax=Pedobacter immunditicola TaxID=3133440 RepID=UPI0030AEFF26